MATQLAVAGLREVSWVEAVDAEAATFTPRRGLTIQREDVLIERNWDGRVYVAAEEAIVQSHLRALARFLADGCEFGLILEDDAELAPDLSQVIAGAIAHASEWDLVSMGGFRSGGRRPAVHIAELGNYDLVASLNPCAGLAAYLVTRHAAERLIARSCDVVEPFDNYVHSPWRHGLRLVDVAPFPARQGSVPSMRERRRTIRRSSPFVALRNLKRHLAADLVGRHLRRWLRQCSTYGITRMTLARWARP
jgi:glycosyl transferase family 25